MNNNDVKNVIEKMNESTKDVYDQLILDSLLEIKYRNRLEGSVLEKIILVHLSFFSDSNYLEYEELKKHLKTLKKLRDKEIVDDEYVYIRKNAFYNHIKDTKESQKLKIETLPKK